jgi:hypothetical protein
VRRATELGLAPTVLGEVHPDETRQRDSAAEDLVTGTKGVDGGAVRLVGSYR